MADCLPIPRRLAPGEPSALARRAWTRLHRRVRQALSATPTERVGPRAQTQPAHVAVRRPDPATPLPALVEAAIARYIEYADGIPDAGPYFPPVAINLLV